MRLALRYLAGKNNNFLSFLNLIAFLGIVVGLFSLIVVSSVMNGLSNDMARRIVSTKGEIRVFRTDFSPIINYEDLIVELEENYVHIDIAGPVNQNEILLRRRHLTAYTENFGIDYAKHKDINSIFDMMVIGNPTEEDFRNNGIVLGLDIAFQINTTVGDTLDVVSPTVLVPTPLGLIPRTERYRVVGIFQSGMPEFDRLFSFIDIERSKNFKRHNGVDFIEIKTNLKDMSFSKLTQQIERDMPLITAQSWEEFDKTLFQAIQIEKIAMFIVMTIIIVLASFNITGNFIRTVTEKREEIAILKTLGMDRKEIFAFFMIMGLFICSAGIVIADILAFIVLFFQYKYEFILIPIPGFPFSAVPVDLSFWRFVSFSILTLLICTLGTIYPAYKTMNINIIDVLHEEQQN